MVGVALEQAWLLKGPTITLEFSHGHFLLSISPLPSLRMTLLPGFMMLWTALFKSSRARRRRQICIRFLKIAALTINSHY